MINVLAYKSELFSNSIIQLLKKSKQNQLDSRSILYMF